MVLLFQIKCHVSNYESTESFDKVDVQRVICQLQQVVYLVTNWVMISYILSPKYWIKIFPFELFSIYIGIFYKIFGSFSREELFRDRSIVNFVLMFGYIQVFVYILRCIILNKINAMKALQSDDSNSQMNIMQVKRMVDFKTLDLLRESTFVCNRNFILYKNEFGAKKFGQTDLMNQLLFSVHKNWLKSPKKSKQMSIKQILMRRQTD
jgi:hypothetical protein